MTGWLLAAGIRFGLANSKDDIQNFQNAFKNQYYAEALDKFNKAYDTCSTNDIDKKMYKYSFRITIFSTYHYVQKLSQQHLHCTFHRYQFGLD